MMQALEDYTQLKDSFKFQHLFVNKNIQIAVTQCLIEQGEEEKEDGLMFDVLDGNEKVHFQGILRGSEIIHQSEDNVDLDQTIKFIKRHLHSAFDENKSIELKQVEEKLNLQMKMKTVIGKGAKQRIKSSFINVILEQINCDQENEFKILEEQMILEKLKQQIRGYQFCEKIYIDDFKKLLEKNWYKSDVIVQNSIEFNFIINDEDIKFNIGILENGNLDYLDIKLRALFIMFPTGEFKRGDEEPRRFLPRQILRNDLISLKVIKDKQFFIISLNSFDLPPFKLKQDFQEYSFLIQIESEQQLPNIISDNDI